MQSWQGVVAVLVALGTASGAAPAVEDKPPAWQRAASSADGRELTLQHRDKIRLGLAWLASQQRADGSIGTPNGADVADYPVANTALTGLAFLAGGHVPGRGRYGALVQRALDYVLAEAEASPIGYLGDGGRMYSHGFATLFLAEALGLTDQPDVQQRVRVALDHALRLVEGAQDEHGGWWYEPNANSGDEGTDISVTISQVMGLRAAQAAGRKVSAETIRRAIRVVKAASYDDGHFAYRVIGTRQFDNKYQLPRSAAGVCALYLMGEYDSRELKLGLGWLDRALLDDKAIADLDPRFYYYALYYATIGVYQWGGEAWARHFPKIRDRLLERQEPDGHFAFQHAPNQGHFASAMALIALQVPCRFLPILQR